LWVLSLASERRHRVGAARFARYHGSIALCDRFPQSQLPRFNEGTIVDHWQHHRSWLLRLAARRELAAIRYAEADPPDLVVKLHARPEIVARRRPDIPLSSLIESAALVRALRFPPHTRVVDIDASQPLEHVLRRVKAAIWELV
jgi:hypothetical protein